jgi:LytS/YehU family sensor histidine kinase
MRFARAPLYLLWSLFWVLMIVIALRDYFRGSGAHWWEPVLWEGTSAAAATAWLSLQRRVDHDYSVYLDKPLLWFGHHLKWLPLMSVSFVAAVYGARHGVYALLGHTYSHESWGSLFVYETIKLVLFVGLWLGVIFGLDSYAQWQMQRQRLAILQKSLAEAQLSQLRAQLRPHFFFNALNTISALMHIDVARADRLLMRLGDLLRYSLQPLEQELVSLREEVRLLELYAQIMLERFADRVTLAWRIGEDTLTAEVPALLLQPLLENAFKHAVESSAAHVHVEIDAHREAGALILVLRNTGSTLAAGFREGVGLRNCRERLNVIYADAATLHLTETAGTVAARVTLPWREHHA